MQDQYENLDLCVYFSFNLKDGGDDYCYVFVFVEVYCLEQVVVGYFIGVGVF